MSDFHAMNRLSKFIGRFTHAGQILLSPGRMQTVFAAWYLTLVFAFASLQRTEAQVFWAKGFLSNTSTGVGASVSSIGGESAGSWAGSALTPTDQFLSINATDNGEMRLWTGSNSTAKTDLTSRTDLHLLLTLRLTPGNQCERLLVGLRSGSGNEKVWEIPAASFSTGAFRTVAVPISATPFSATGTLNLAAVDRVILRVQESSGTATILQLERLALAEIPATGVVRIVGEAQPSDPFGAAYYPTIQRAVEASRPRDLVWVRPGTYHESVRLTKDYGLPETGLQIIADPSGPVILDGQAALNASNNFTGLENGFDWSDNQNSSKMIRANHITIEGFIVRNFVSMGFGNRNPGHITIRHCVVHSNGTCGIGMNFPRADTRLRILSNVTFLNGWGEAWAGGIHINNKGFRLNSLATDASGQQLPNDTDPGHEIVGNLSFLNLDESAYNTDGNGIMLDYGGASEADITDNIVFFNAGGGLRNLNGRVRFERNIVYRNGWDHRGEPGETQSNNEQIGFLIRYDTAVEPGLTRDQFLHRTYPHFLSSRLKNNLIRTASRMNFAGPYFQYGNDAQQSASLAQFALEYGTWDLFNGQFFSSKWWHVQYGYQLDPADSGGNQLTDDQIGLTNPYNDAQTVQPITRQPNLSQTFPVHDGQVFLQQPGPDYVPPAIEHIFGHSFFQVDGTVTTFSEATQSIGMVWDNSVREDISPKLSTVVTSPPPLDLADFDFTIPDTAAPKFRACRPLIPFSPDYRAVFDGYLRSFFDDNNPASRLPYTFSAAPTPTLPVGPAPDAIEWLEAEDLYSTALHRNAPIPRWRLSANKDGPFGSPFLVAYDLNSLSYLNRDNALLAQFSLSVAASPALRFRLHAPAGGNPNNDSFFLRLVALPGSTPITLPLKAAYQVPAPASTTRPELTSAGNGWYRVFFDPTSRQVFDLHLPLPALPPGTYEIQIQNRQRDVWLDRLALHLPDGSQMATAVNPPAVNFADWQSVHLPAELAGDPEHLNPWADANGLGMDNLLRVALGGATDATILPWISLSTHEAGRLELTFRYNGLLEGVFAVLEQSTDLRNWSPLAAAEPGGRFLPQQDGALVHDGQGAVRTVVITPVGNSPFGFWRLWVSR